jgi:hypothetical protein
MRSAPKRGPSGCCPLGSGQGSRIVTRTKRNKAPWNRTHASSEVSQGAIALDEREELYRLVQHVLDRVRPLRAGVHRRRIGGHGRVRVALRRLPGPVRAHLDAGRARFVGLPLDLQYLRGARFSAARLARGRSAASTTPTTASRIVSIPWRFAPATVPVTRESLRPTGYTRPSAHARSLRQELRRRRIPRHHKRLPSFIPDSSPS